MITDALKCMEYELGCEKPEGRVSKARWMMMIVRKPSLCRVRMPYEFVSKRVSRAEQRNVIIPSKCIMILL
jgi:hypothetical protein